MKMTNKQKMFVAEYLIDLNATQAASRAGYSKKTADVQGIRLLGNVMVQEALQKRMKDREARTEVTQDRIVKELARVAFGDARKVMSWGPSGVRLTESTELSDDAAAMVAEASETTSVGGGSIKLKLNDRMKALELLGRHMGMFTDKIEHSGEIANAYAALTTEELRKLIRDG